MRAGAFTVGLTLRKTRFLAASPMAGILLDIYLLWMVPFCLSGGRFLPLNGLGVQHFAAAAACAAPLRCAFSCAMAAATCTAHLGTTLQTRHSLSAPASQRLYYHRPPCLPVCCAHPPPPPTCLPVLPATAHHLPAAGIGQTVVTARPHFISIGLPGQTSVRH